MTTTNPVTGWLDPACGLPLDRPFTLHEARDRGFTARHLTGLVEAGLLVRPVRGVYYAGQLRDTLDLRVDCLRLVVPVDCVVVDRTAGWLLGAPMVLAPGDHLVTPKVALARPPGYRLWQPLTAGCERMLRPEDVIQVGGLMVTTPLRTACDLGRLLSRLQAFAAMNALAATGGFTVPELVAEVGRFKGYRGVIQLREIAGDVDPRPQSPPESAMLRLWLDRCPDLPRPEPQLTVCGPWGEYFLDLGVRELRYGLEYYGEEFHGEDRQPHDEQRCRQLERVGGFVMDVVRAPQVYGPRADLDLIIRSGIARARARRGGR